MIIVVDNDDNINIKILSEMIFWSGIPYAVQLHKLTVLSYQLKITTARLKKGTAE